MPPTYRCEGKGLTLATLREPASFQLVRESAAALGDAALVLDPSIAEGISRLILMAGADSEGGNITPFSEFNVFADPHAAAIVFQSGIPATVVVDSRPTVPLSKDDSGRTCGSARADTRSNAVSRR